MSNFKKGILTNLDGFSILVSEKAVNFFEAASFARVSSSECCHGTEEWVLSDILTLKALAMLASYEKVADTSLFAQSLSECWSCNVSLNDTRAYLVNFKDGDVTTFFKNVKYRAVLVKSSERQAIILAALKAHYEKRFTFFVNLENLCWSAPVLTQYETGKLDEFDFVASKVNMSFYGAEEFSQTVSNQMVLNCEEWCIPDPLTLLAFFVIDHQKQEAHNLIRWFSSFMEKKELDGFYWASENNLEQSEFMNSCHHGTIGLCRLRKVEKCQVILLKLQDIPSICKNALEVIKRNSKLVSK